ncbi:ANTAR domain-containing protein [Modestobacter sp. I12A-02628]|uniref:ANTAR domain-containing protein n=1 Tax=Goekera deserti TaxID=2497753 RepID=A0A7K3W7Q5_9ACTN|nr:ANTAR domain-containing protein [Goekera deserti]NDI50011.1 ANTAR domain-containing protein [Goekera deserti]NEL52512.1 ANTAR domain-containing protein [Goekera deserti]
MLAPHGEHTAGDLVEALSLADLVVEELDVLTRPTPPPRPACPADEPGDDDPVGRELAALRRTVGQLEHALVTRVCTERAIGVLAERQRQSPRAAFEGLRREARASGRLVHDLAREVLDGLDVAAAAGPPVGLRPAPFPAPTPGQPPLRHAGTQDAAPLLAPAPAAPSDETAARSGPRRVSRTLRPGVTRHRVDGQP